ncbi:hypothetical protein AN639_03775 [Candidatus Epulonipiscium fishelsonii]|uniref:Uncharacterized protein n=1 Tax=Candidatus Epulonipiscium fishelsonii TaxID=77094 RepID=A0ACC8X766_9FIRM|nr:hypothetical protein AN396_12750 [Epulopiscium sp. SCG-B11WGA-EpuloA1]ONI41481.1 hypothetical protein AN639_03775 [Epulopiscium sp. SCG-B05WGA-EpuloA1]
MKITQIRLNNFRNYDNLELNLSQNRNIFIGDNAQGKTNILEAIYMCATARSHRTNYAKEAIKFEQMQAIINLKLQKKYFDESIEFTLNRTNKIVNINSQPLKKVKELFGCLSLIMFSPEDLEIIKKSPKDRRKFIDLALCQYDKVYYHDLQQYCKILNQRNNLLKQKNTQPEILDSWDEQLIYYGLRTIEKRKKFIGILNKLANKIHLEISNQNENLEIIYTPNCSQENFVNKLLANRKKDIIAKTTSIGPHKDDFKILINNYETKIYGSQGQQRTAILSIKIAELENLKQTLNDYPILLLDDVLSELDSKRQAYLMNYTKHIQTFITGTEINPLLSKNTEKSRIYFVTNGNVRI